MRLINKKSVVHYKHYEHFRRAVAAGGPRRVELTLAGSLSKMGVAGSGGVFIMNFPSARSMKRAVSNWTKLHGLKLFINNRDCGVVSRNNPSLAT
jgi:hypothetical protein